MPTLVQSQPITASSSGTTQTWTLTSVGAGDLLVLAIYSGTYGGANQSSPPVTSVADSAGQTWTIDANHVLSARAGSGIAFAHLANANAGTHTVTVTVGTASFVSGVMAEYSGVATSGALDVNVLDDPNAVVTSISASGAPTFPAELALFWVGADEAATWTAPAGFAARYNGSTVGQLSDATLASAGSITPTATASIGAKAAAILVTFRDSTVRAAVTSPASAIATSTGNTVTIQGSNTAWTTGTTFSASAGTITGQSVNAGTQVATLTYTAPATAQTVTFSETADTATCTLAVLAAATALTLSGPATGFAMTASGAFAVALSPSGGAVSGTVTVTPASTGSGDTFSPATVALTTAAPSATFTLTPGATVGARQVTLTNNASNPTLTDPSALTYTTSARKLAQFGPVWFLPKYQDCSMEVQVAGDDNVNGSLTVQYRVHGASAWRNTMPAWRVATGVSAVIASVTAGSPASFATQTSHGLTVGQTVHARGLDAYGVLGCYLVGTVPTGTTFTLTNLDGSAVTGISTFINGAALTITGVTNTTNPTITTSGPHGYIAGQWVVQSGILGALGANGIFKVGTVPTGSTYTITNLDGTSVPAPGAYTSGGSVVSPPIVAPMQSPRTWYHTFHYLAALGNSTPVVYDVQLALTDPDGYVGSDPVTVTAWNGTDKTATTQQVTPSIVGNTATLTILSAFQTLPDSIPLATSFTPTRYVDGHNGSDSNAGTSLAAAWRTLANAAASAPANAVVGVVAGNLYACPAGTACGTNGVTFVPVNSSGLVTSAVLPLTLAAEAHGNDTYWRATAANEGGRVVVDPGVMTIPTGATPNNDGGRTEIAGPWTAVNVSGVADPTKTFVVRKWAASGHSPAQPQGFSATRTGEPQQLLTWKGSNAVIGALGASTPAGPDGLGYNVYTPAGWIEYLHDGRPTQATSADNGRSAMFGALVPGMTQAALANPTVAPTLVAGTPTALADPGGAPTLGGTTGYTPKLSGGLSWYPFFANSTNHTVAYAWGNQAGWTKASATATVACGSAWTAGDGSTSTYQSLTTHEAAPAGTTRLGIFVDGFLAYTIASPSTGAATTFTVSGPAVYLTGLAAVAAPTLNGTAATSYGAGVVTAAYAWRSAGGETQVGPTATVTLTAGQYWSGTTPAAPAGCVGVGWYGSIAVGNSTLGLVGSTAANGTFVGNAVAPASGTPASNTSALAADDMYVRIPTPTGGSGGGLPEQDPNTLYVEIAATNGNGDGLLKMTGTNQRVYGFELRSSGWGLQATSTTQNAVFDRCYFPNDLNGVSLAGTRGTPDAYGDLVTLQYCLFTGTLQYSTDPTDRSMTCWNTIKGGYGGSSQQASVDVNGGVTRLVMRYNTISGQHDSGPVWESGWDRYQGYGASLYLNITEKHQDDGPEVGENGCNVSILHNWIAHTLTCLSANNLNYGPVYFIRNQCWRFGGEGEPVDFTQPAAAQISAPQGNALKWGDSGSVTPRLYVVGNTFYSDDQHTVTDYWGQSYNASTTFSDNSAGSFPISFYWRNNLAFCTWTVGKSFGEDPMQPYTAYDADYDACYNPLNAGFGGAKFSYAGANETTIAALRAASAAQGPGQDLHSQPWGTGAFSDDPRPQWTSPTTGDLSLVAGSGFIDAGAVVGGIADQALLGGDLWAAGGGYFGAAPDLGAVEALTVPAPVRVTKTLRLGAGLVRV